MASQFRRELKDQRPGRHHQKENCNALQRHASFRRKGTLWVVVAMILRRMEFAQPQKAEPPKAASQGAAC